VIIEAHLASPDLIDGCLDRSQDIADFGYHVYRTIVHGLTLGTFIAQYRRDCASIYERYVAGRKSQD